MLCRLAVLVMTFMLHAAALADVVKLKDGRSFQVQIVREEAAGVVVRYKDQQHLVPRDQYEWARHTPHRLRVQGEDILLPSGNTVMLRGFNVWACDPHSRHDFQQMKAMGANHVRVFVFHDWQGVRDVDSSGRLRPDALAKLDNIVSWCEELELWMIFTVASQRDHGQRGGDLFASSQSLAEFDGIWNSLIQRYKDRWFIGAYDILNEADLGGKSLSPRMLRDWYVRRIDSIRESDLITPVVVNSTSWGDPTRLVSDAYIVGKGNLIYGFHYYSPRKVTGHEKPISQAYGLSFETLDGRRRLPLDRAYHAHNLRAAERFSSTYRVPIYMGEFGCWNEQPHALRWISDVVDEAEKNRFHWSYFCWRGAYLYGVIWSGDMKSFQTNHELSEVLRRRITTEPTSPVQGQN